ncbi:hypothetical protein CR194_19220 [Salipaludibacillus keqinensis]|uniref:FMN-dependent dehydrogenase domain-containing protein n=2 Tax=Salipaludibacillus keqinensis TaxID=2045207 RepID=A0A323TBK7_9BACI|nr:hypothetical protein CR194_19220 [Salipaludibacillus keqinensis]
MALGADAVLLGRPYVYGLAQGQEGVTSVLRNLLRDLDTSLAIIGSKDFSSIDRRFIGKCHA